MNERTRRRTRACLASASAGLLFAVASCSGGEARSLSLEEIVAADWSTLEVRTITDMPEAQRGGSAAVFLHGYGASGRMFVPLAHLIEEGDRRVFVPTAVLPHPSGRGRMWWGFAEDDWPKPWSDHPEARAPEAPSRQLPPARQAVLRLIAEIREKYAPENLVIAGHSQGAMLALDAGAAADPPVDAIAAIAGFGLFDSVPALSRERARRPEVYLRNGRDDPIVEFGYGEGTKRLLERHGFPVLFAPHDGGHELGFGTALALRDYLRRWRVGTD